MHDSKYTVWKVHLGKRYGLKGLYDMQETGMNQQALKITIHTPQQNSYQSSVLSRPHGATRHTVAVKNHVT